MSMQNERFVDVLESVGQTEESACRVLQDSELRLFNPALVRRFIDEVVLPHRKARAKGNS